MKKSFLSLLLMVPVIAGAAITPSSNLDTDTDGCFLIRDAADLYGFASKVNEDPTVCGKLTNNIIVNHNLLGEDKLPSACSDAKACVLNSESDAAEKFKNYELWTPINEFKGSFDGNGFYISGLLSVVFNYEYNSGVGLFANSASTAVIKNLGLVDSYLYSHSGVVGGFIGLAKGDVQIENCYTTSTFYANNRGAGGFIGVLGDGNGAFNVTISNSYFDGFIIASQNSGAFISQAVSSYGNGMAEITNSYSIGLYMNHNSNETISSSFIGAAEGIGVNVQNVYTFGKFVGSDGGASSFKVSNSFYLGNDEYSGGDCLESCSFKNSDIAAVTAALQGYNANGVDGSVWQNGVNHPVLKVAAVSGGGEVQTTDEGKKVFVIDGNTDATLFVNGEEKVDSVALLRKFTPNAYSTIILPFSGTIKNADVYTFDGVEKIENVWRATLRTVSGNVIVANTPYIIKPADDTLKFDNTNPITIVSNTDTVYVTEKGNWRFTGMYRFKKWVESELTNPSHIYGYAGSGATQKEFSAGQFVRGVAGVHISPTRAFLEYVPVLSRRGMYRIAAPVDLPETIDVVIDDGEKSMTIGKLNTVTGEIKSDRWFDMKGRKLNAKPMVKGIYQNNGRQVIVK